MMSYKKPSPQTYREFKVNYKIFNKKFKKLTTDLSSPLFGRSTYERDFWDFRGNNSGDQHY